MQERCDAAIMRAQVVGYSRFRFSNHPTAALRRARIEVPGALGGGRLGRAEVLLVDSRSSMPFPLPGQLMNVSCQGTKTVVLACVLSLFPGVSAHASINPKVQARVTNAMQELRTYNSTHSFPALKSAIETLANAVEPRLVSPDDYITFRRTIVEDWASILETIERSYDPTYNPTNPNDLPNDCVLPDNRSVTCNVSPDQVQDPKERADYEARLEANAAKARRALQWHNVLVLDTEAMASMQADLQLFAAAGAPSDYAALDGIFRRARISKARMAKIDAILAAPDKY